MLFSFLKGGCIDEQERKLIFKIINLILEQWLSGL